MHLRRTHRTPRSASPRVSPSDPSWPRRSAGRRAFIWSTYRAVTVPAIMGAHHKMKSLACIFIQAPR